MGSGCCLGTDCMGNEAQIHVAGLIPVGVGDQVRSINQKHFINFDLQSSLLQRLALKRGHRLLTRVRDATDLSPQTIVCTLAQQHPAGIVENNCTHARQPQGTVAHAGA